MAAAAETFDFIVTGAGSAGCAVAGRLRQIDPTLPVLLMTGASDDFVAAADEYMEWLTAAMERLCASTGLEPDALLKKTADDYRRKDVFEFRAFNATHV